MDYEKKYKNALEWAKQVMNGETGFIRKEVEEIFPELKESEDERIRETITAVIGCYDSENSYFKEVSKKKCLAWLEKQGELQYWKPSEEQLEALDYAYNSCPDTERGNYYESVLGTLIDELYKLQEKQREQKPFASKVEPKFKVGDWITTEDKDVHEDYRICRICKVDNDKYYIENGDFFNKGTLDAYEYHIWTIQDAKAGDVLASDKSIFIFQEEYIAEKPVAYCGLMNGLFIEGENACWTNEKCHPATKEQRDLLFQKMHEAGYEWNAEHKQLKKIEQKPADARTTGYWNVEDAMKEVEEKAEAFTNAHQGENADEILAQMRGEKNSTWSEEDEDVLEDIEEAIINYWHGDTQDILLDWLKSLRPQNTWKPSKEQMETLLSEVNGWTKGCPKQKVLESLYNDLMKLYGTDR